MMHNVITRFAPSPTGLLHIGGARTALFNFLFSRHYGGKFLLRIEDTDQKRSTQDSISAILSGLSFLGIYYDEDPIYQSRNITRHQQIAMQLLNQGSAYYCYETEEERTQARNKGERYNRKWRNPKNTPPINVKPSIRIKAPYTGSTHFSDLIQGPISADNQSLDDFIILRSDGMPTYMLSSVVDDFDMKITHIIRGTDHLSNTLRQIQIYHALNWPLPQYAHVPLIHDINGMRLSKRSGDLGIQHYQKEGFLSDALCNYLLRLGWSHGNDEIISMQEAIKWFSLDHVNQSPAKLNVEKMRFLNQVYIKKHSDIVSLLEEWKQESFSKEIRERLKKGMPETIKRAYTLKEIFDQTTFYRKCPNMHTINIEPSFSLDILLNNIEEISCWEIDTIKKMMQEFCDSINKKLKDIMPILRIILTGETETPGIFFIMYVLGKKETCFRLREFLKSKLKKLNHKS